MKTGLRPFTIRLVTTNLDFATGAVKDADHLQHLVKVMWALRPAKVTGVVLGAQEARNFRLGQLLGGLISKLRLTKLAPKVVQGEGLSRSGTAIAAFGVKLHHAHLILSALASKVTMARWITRAGVDVDGGRLEVFVVHIKPPRAGRDAQLKQLATVAKLCRRAENRGHGWAVLADFNLPADLIAAGLSGVYYGTPRGIGIAVSKRVRVGSHGPDTYGEDHHETDHPAWFVDVDGITP